MSITNFEFSRHEQLVRNFCQLAASGNVMPGDPPGHGDGWGLAYYRNGELEVLKSGGNLLEEAGELLETLGRVGASPLVMLHLRKSAWSDTSSTRHAHPFRYDNTFFAHNGVVYGYQGLLPEMALPGLGEDALDTEVFFYHFLSAHLNSAGKLGLGEAFLRTVELIGREYRFSALNCIFSDGARLYAYRDFSKEPEYYSLYKACAETSCIVSSQPIDAALCWELMEKGEFLEIPLCESR
jgi:glutamine amidotransferase